jgi:hypothetical protein
VELWLDPFAFDPEEHDPRARRVRAADVGERRLVTDGVQRLAHGALACPACALPLAPQDSVGAGSGLVCPFCDHSAPAREFLVRNVYDTVANEVYLIARLA